MPLRGVTTEPAAEEEFVAFVSARYPALVRTAVLLAGDRGHAEDLVQDALQRTFLRWRRLHGPQYAEAYTRRVMLRLAGRARRRRWRGEVPTEVLDRGAADPWDDVDEGERVRTALQRLPWPQRAVLVLRFFDDLPVTEVAELLGCSTGTVKSRTSRGLDALRTSGLLDPAPREARDG